MKTFKDSMDREWFVSINIGSLKKLKAADINLALPMLPRKGAILPVWQEVMQDDALLSDALWTLLKSQADANGVKGIADFDAALDTDTIAAARDALAGALADFSQPGNRAIVLETVEEVRKLPARMAEMTKLSGERSTNSPESSALTPTD